MLVNANIDIDKFGMKSDNPIHCSDLEMKALWCCRDCRCGF